MDPAVFIEREEIFVPISDRKFPRRVTITELHLVRAHRFAATSFANAASRYDQLAFCHALAVNALIRKFVNMDYDLTHVYSLYVYQK